MPDTKKPPIRRVGVLIGLVVCVLLVSGGIIWSISPHRNLNDELITAAKAGNVTEIKQLLDSGADPNASELIETSPQSSSFFTWIMDPFDRKHTRHRVGDTALTCAIHSLHPYEAARLLISRGAHANGDTGSGSENVIYAARKGSAEAIALLAANGASLQFDPRVCNEFRADMRLQLAKLGVAVPKANANETRPNPHCNSMIPNPHDAEFFDAVKRDDLAVVKRLLDAGEDYYTENNEGASALDLAAFYGHIDLLNLFIQAGADASDINYSSSKTPLDYAIENPANVPTRLKTVAILLEHGNALPPHWIKKFVKRMAANKANSRAEIEALLNQHVDARYKPAVQHSLLGPRS